MADEESAGTPEDPKTSRVEHVRIGEGDKGKLTGKKIPPWGIAAIVGGVALVAYYIYKKRKESAATPEYLPAQTGGEYGGYLPYLPGGYGTGNNETNGSLLAQIKKWEEEQEAKTKKWEEEHKTPPGTTTTKAPEGASPTPPGTTTEAGKIGIPEWLLPGNTPVTVGPVGGNTLTQNPAEIEAGERSRKEYQEAQARAASPAVSPQVTSPPQPAPSYITEAGKALTTGFGTTGPCPSQYPFTGPHGCYRDTTRNGCQCHEYRNGTTECQHRDAQHKCVW